MKPAFAQRSSITRFRYLLFNLLFVAGAAFLLTACDSKTADKYDVFLKYFHSGMPTNASVYQSSSFEARDGPMSDGGELILDARLPRDFLQSTLPVTPGSPVLSKNVLESLFGFGETNVNDGVDRAMTDAPPWFQPEDATRFSVATNNVHLSHATGYAAITFAHRQPTNQFELWVSDYGWSRLFIDRQTGHIFAHHKYQ